MLQLSRKVRILALLIVAAAPFIPDPPPAVERDFDLDIELVRAAEARYRGITATFEELTRAYALTAYTDAELLGWEARASLQHPETESLVTCRFRVRGVRAEADTGAGVHALRASAGETLEVTWRLSTLSSVQVSPHGAFARDALHTLRLTIDGYLASMVLLTHDTPLWRGPPAAGSSGLRPLDDAPRDDPPPEDAPLQQEGVQLRQGEILLRQDRRAGWSHVRVPAGSLAGWLPDSLLMPVNPR